MTRKSAPVKDKLEVDLVTGQLELQQCQERLQELGEAVECASDPARLRLLSGDNPSRNQLSDKIDTLEVCDVEINHCSMYVNRQIFCHFSVNLNQV